LALNNNRSLIGALRNKGGNFIISLGSLGRWEAIFISPLNKKRPIYNLPWITFPIDLRMMNYGCLYPLSTKFHLYQDRSVSTGRGNRSTRKKTLILCKLMTNFITKCCIKQDEIQLCLGSTSRYKFLFGIMKWKRWYLIYCARCISGNCLLIFPKKICEY
jgi:hypothetical protein